MNKGNSTIEFLVVMLLVASIGLVLLLPFIQFSPTGTGKHTGYITAIEQEGYLFQNYRVYFKTDLSSSQEDVYCLNRVNTGLAQELENRQQDKVKTTIEFKGVRGIGLGLCDDIEITNLIK